MSNSSHGGNIPSVAFEKPKTSAKAASSVRSAFEAPSFRSRYLTDDQDVFSQNAWDHVPLPTDQEAKVAEALHRQRNAPVPETEKLKYNDNPSRHWDIFYKNNADNFFRDRKWLHLEFPELVDATQPEAGPVTILEVGCGAGNAVFPLLSVNQNPALNIVACDYSPRAVSLVKSHALYDFPPTGNITASLWDITSNDLPECLTPGSVDIVVMIFVLSALHPNEWYRAITNVHMVLKPGGRVVLRDYGRYDLAQLRFKGGRLLSDNFYIRGDNTRVYFFTLDDLATIFTGSPLPETSQTNTHTVVETESEKSGEATPTRSQEGLSAADSPVVDSDMAFGERSLGSRPRSLGEPPDTSSLSLRDSPGALSLLSPDDKASLNPFSPRHPLFSINQLGVDNRLLVNRKRQLKMHRVWMQGKFIKLPQENATHSLRHDFHNTSHPGQRVGIKRE